MGGTRVALRARRREQGFSRPSLAKELGCSVDALKSWEQGRRAPQPETRKHYAKALDVSPSELNTLLFGAAAPNGHAIPSWLDRLAKIEQGAATVWAFEPVVVHGLLQTPEYATAVESFGPVQISASHVAAKVEARIARQAALGDLERLTVILDESVLYRIAGGPGIMAGQLDHLDAAAQRPNVTLRILALDAGVFSAAFGSFSIYSSSAPYMAITEDRAGPHYLDRESDLAAHITLSEYVEAQSLSPTQTVDLIRTVRERYQ